MSDGLINGILSDSRKFETFFKEKYRILCFIAGKYVKDIDEAEEIVQDVFVKLWEKRDQIEIKGPEMAYVSTSVKNSCLNHLKHKAIMAEHEKSEALRMSFDPSETEQEMGDMELETAILNAIAELPPQRQKIFSMSRVEGLKYHEIAEKLGLSIKTVEAQMGTALKQLRVKLREFTGIFI